MWDADLYKRALDFAAKAHGDQKVPGSGFPYVVHVTKVAMEVLHAAPADVDVAMACALLHDCVEDAGVTVEQVSAAFGPVIAAGVSALTKDESVPKPERMRDALERIRKQPRAVWCVKLADRITNLEPAPPLWSDEKKRAYLAEAGVILEALRGASAALENRLETKMKVYLDVSR